MFGFSELEEKLLGDNGAETLRSTLDVVRAIKAEAQSALSQGLAAADHASAQSIVNAATAAEAILLAPIKTDGA